MVRNVFLSLNFWLPLTGYSNTRYARVRSIRVDYKMREGNTVVHFFENCFSYKILVLNGANEILDTLYVVSDITE